MKIFNVFVGISFIIIGISSIYYYQNHVKKDKNNGLTFKIQSAGIGAIIIGIGLIYREIKN